MTRGTIERIQCLKLREKQTWGFAENRHPALFLLVYKCLGVCVETRGGGPDDGMRVFAGLLCT